ncbi:MAG: O-antigen ligase family protein [Candidatus Nanosynbacter sp.]|nr:O-antigen ligase family protein [Candidatus Nanosynbacter sp.]
MTKKSTNKINSRSLGSVTSSLSKIQKVMLLCLPFCLFFSYHPVIPIFSTSTTNFELSIPLLWLLIFAILSLPENFRLYIYSLRIVIKTKSLVNKTPRPSSHHKTDKLYPHFLRLFTLAYPFFVTVNSIGSPNFLRAILTSGVIWCICLSLLTILQNISQYKTQIGKSVNKNLLIAGTLASTFCWLQSILDIAGVPREATFLCKGCISTVFGFPHPNGFAIEPQFMANLLLAPIFLSLFYLLERPKKHSNKLNSDPYPASRLGHFFRFGLPLFLVATLYLTLSRGAIFSFWVSVFVLFIYQNIKLIKQKSCRREILFRQPLIFSAVVFLPLFFTLSAQGLFTELGPTSHTFFDGVSTSVSQLSLGRIDLTKVFHKTNENNKSHEAHETHESNKLHLSNLNTDAAASVQKAPQFTSYIEESTNIRLNLNRLALSSWRTSLRRMLAGVGLGAAGLTLYQEFPELGSPKEIIQNEYLAILYEQGICGVIMIICVAILFVLTYKLHNKNHEKTSIYGRVLALSFALTLCFFSGLPNALHIYLLTPLFFLL